MSWDNIPVRSEIKEELTRMKNDGVIGGTYSEVIEGLIEFYEKNKREVPAP